MTREEEQVRSNLCRSLHECTVYLQSYNATYCTDIQQINTKQMPHLIILIGQSCSRRCIYNSKHGIIFQFQFSLELMVSYEFNYITRISIHRRWAQDAQRPNASRSSISIRSKQNLFASSSREVVD